MEGNPLDENDLASDYRYQQYLQNITRIGINKKSLGDDTTLTQEPHRFTNFHYQYNFWKNSSNHYTNITQTILASPRWFRKFYRNNTTHVLLNTSKNGLLIAKLACRQKKTTTSSRPKCWTAQNGIRVLKTYCKWTSYRIYHLAGILSHHNGNRRFFSVFVCVSSISHHDHSCRTSKIGHSLFPASILTCHYTYHGVGHLIYCPSNTWSSGSPRNWS